MGVDGVSDRRQRGGCLMFLTEFKALLIKMLLLTKRRRAQTIAEIILAYVFLALLLAMRSLLDRTYHEPLRIPTFRPHDLISAKSTRANMTYYYPPNLCAMTIVTNAMNNLAQNVTGLPNNVSVIPSSDISSLPNSTLESLYAYIYFTNIDPSCNSPAMMPDNVEYTLRMQENGLNYYRAQQAKQSRSDILWKRAPEDFCQDNKTWVNYTTQFLGVQYYVDLSIIEYVTSINQNASSIFLNHFGCPELYLDPLHTGFGFFVPLFYAIIFVVTFILNVGYMVEERANKTKEYLRIFGLRTWVNNLVWMVRSMCIFFVLTCVLTGLSVAPLKSSSGQKIDATKAVFNSSHWTLVWTVLFVYSIHVSCFAVFFSQLFKRVLLAKLVGFVLWILTFIDFYGSAPVAVRYILCLFPNTGLLFCIQVMQQYERRGGEMATFRDLYSNIFDYPLYIGLCLLLMLIFSAIYVLLAIYVERINPGEFGVSQRWNFFLKKSYWSPSSSSVQPSEANGHVQTSDDDDTRAKNRWIEMIPADRKKTPSLSIEHLTKKFGKVEAVSDVSVDFYEGEVCTLLGHNGAGKTTTTFILVGMLEPTSGRVTIQGLDNQAHIEEIRHNLGFCPQYDILYDVLSVEEHLELIGKMRHMEKEAMKKSIETILQLIGLTNDRTTLSKDLSGGMKRRLSIGISLINDPKVIILDEPTSGIDPYNRRLIWTIIRKLKGTGKCVLLTTHFLEEADVLSDRMAIMSRGRLQANGTPDFLKQQTEFEYRLMMDKQATCSTEIVTRQIEKYVPEVVLERESAAELVYGIKRGQAKEIERLIDGLDRSKQAMGINSYGLSMTTIEDVFLRLVEEEESAEEQAAGKPRKQLDDAVFRKQYERVRGAGLFGSRLWALLVKRWHVSRRQISLLVGFLLLPLLIEILCVAVVPTPQAIQATLTRNERVVDARVVLTPSIYNPQTIVSYSNENPGDMRSRLLSSLSLTGATVDELSQDDVLNYVRARYRQTAEIFLNKYQVSFASYNNGSSAVPSKRFDAFFSTVNYHTMATSLGVAATNLFQLAANSSSKSIVTTNQPIITNAKGASYIADILSVLYCFEAFPASLFSFLNSILATIFIGILMLTLVSERLNHSKDLQLLTKLSRRTYWLSNWLFDLALCLIMCGLLSIVVKIGSAANPKSDAEVRIYRDGTAMGYFFVLYLMYTLASLPFMYLFSFIPRTSVIGFTNFFILNVIANIIDAVINSFTVFTRNDTPSLGPSPTFKTVTTIRTILACLLPSVNLKHALSNSQLHENKECIGIFNTYIGTKLSVNSSWTAIDKSGVGAELLIFFFQILSCWVILIVVESRPKIRQAWQRCSSKDDAALAAERSRDWDDSQLDEDVQKERRSILQQNATTGTDSSKVIVVRDLMKTFKKRKNKSLRRRLYTAVDHLTFHVPPRACFGLLGANGAGKTTTFRMLVSDIKATSGEIIIDGNNINETSRTVEVGFCPQFDWLVTDLSVGETLLLFARLKGVKPSEVPSMCRNMLQLFGLEMYENRQVQRLSGGNKRKVSAALAFMGNPSLVFLDEPTTGLDAAAKRKLWKVIRSARDLGLTIIMTSHSMEECEALCTKLGIMKSGQFVCLGSLQHLRNRFGTGYGVQVKVAGDDVNRVKNDLLATLPGIIIQDEQNEMLFCSVPFGSDSSSSGLSHVFGVLNAKKEEKLIETYSVTQASLEQIFIQLAGDDEETTEDRQRANRRAKDDPVMEPMTTRF